MAVLDHPFVANSYTTMQTKASRGRVIDLTVVPKQSVNDRRIRYQILHHAMQLRNWEDGWCDDNTPVILQWYLQ